MGNKSDLSDSIRQVSFQEAVELAQELNLSAVFETSAKTNSCIDDIFFRSVLNCLQLQCDRLTYSSDTVTSESHHQKLIRKNSNRSITDILEPNSGGNDFLDFQQP